MTKLVILYKSGNSSSAHEYDEACSDTSPQSTISCSTGGDYTVCGYSPYSFSAGTGYRINHHAEIWDPAEPQLSTALIALSVMFQNPVIWTFEVTHVLANAYTGYVSVSGSDYTQGSHAALLAGYVSNERVTQEMPGTPPAQGNGYFIVKNSWSNNTGDAGYLYVPWDYVAKHTYGALVLHKVQ